MVHYREHKQNKHTYTQSGAKKSLFQLCLTITEPRFLLKHCAQCKKKQKDGLPSLTILIESLI